MKIMNTLIATGVICSALSFSTFGESAPTSTPTPQAKPIQLAWHNCWYDRFGYRHCRYYHRAGYYYHRHCWRGRWGHLHCRW